MDFPKFGEWDKKTCINFGESKSSTKLYNANNKKDCNLCLSNHDNKKVREHKKDYLGPCGKLPKGFSSCKKVNNEWWVETINYKDKECAPYFEKWDLKCKSYKNSIKKTKLKNNIGNKIENCRKCISKDPQKDTNDVFLKKPYKGPCGKIPKGNVKCIEDGNAITVEDNDDPECYPKWFPRMAKCLDYNKSKNIYIIHGIHGDDDKIVTCNKCIKEPNCVKNLIKGEGLKCNIDNDVVFAESNNNDDIGCKTFPRRNGWPKYRDTYGKAAYSMDFNKVKDSKDPLKDCKKTIKDISKSYNIDGYTFIPGKSQICKFNIPPCNDIDECQQFCNQKGFLGKVKKINSKKKPQGCTFYKGFDNYPKSINKCEYNFLETNVKKANNGIWCGKPTSEPKSECRLLAPNYKPKCEKVDNNTFRLTLYRPDSSYANVSKPFFYKPGWSLYRGFYIEKGDYANPNIMRDVLVYQTNKNSLPDPKG